MRMEVEGTGLETCNRMMKEVPCFFFWKFGKDIQAKYINHTSIVPRYVQNRELKILKKWMRFFFPLKLTGSSSQVAASISIPTAKGLVSTMPGSKQYTPGKKHVRYC